MDLSLFVSTNSGFVYGLIFHAVKRRCTDPDCGAYANDDGTVWSYNSSNRIFDHEHGWSYPIDAPAPGIWSFHP